MPLFMDVHTIDGGVATGDVADSVFLVEEGS